MKKPIRLTAALTLTLAIAACSDSATETPAPQDSAKTTNSESVAAVAPVQAPAAHPPVTQAAPAADPHAGLMRPASNGMNATNNGRVVDVIQTSSYSYLQVDDNGRQVWLAANRVEVEPGMNVNWGDSAVMRNFHSKALNRTFNEIMFVSTVIPGPGTAAAATAGGGTTGEVLTVSNAGGYSYLQVKTASGEQWVAAPMTAVATGDQVNWQGGAVMHNFSSKALNRSFDEIVFVGGLNVRH